MPLTASRFGALPAQRNFHLNGTFLPPTYENEAFTIPTMPENYKEIEDRITEALHAYYERNEPKIAPLSREFRVPYRRLRARIQGGKSRSTRQATNKCLDNSQEQALISWIGILDTAGCAPTPQDIEGCANDILARDNTAADQRVGKN